MVYISYVSTHIKLISQANGRNMGTPEMKQLIGWSPEAVIDGARGGDGAEVWLSGSSGQLSVSWNVMMAYSYTHSP